MSGGSAGGDYSAGRAGAGPLVGRGQANWAPSVGQLFNPRHAHPVEVEQQQRTVAQVRVSQ
ncbi:hypothetical protein GCM10010350_38820 [Streptomyces galilaeus]|nr:hypothetical protein GCM10010350_38820 [Streptomyces galilaeus]